jgi:hypothetical protein
VGRILQGKDVVLDGQFRLALAQVQPSSPRGKNTVSDPAARIVESHSELAVIEVTCSCGARMYLQCKYADVEASADEPEQTN